MAREVEELEQEDEWHREKVTEIEADEDDNRSAAGGDSLDFGGSSACSDREHKPGDDEADGRFDYVACLTDVFRYLYRKVGEIVCHGLRDPEIRATFFKRCVHSKCSPLGDPKYECSG